MKHSGAQKDNTASTATTDTHDNWITASAQSTADTSAQQSAAVANGEVWKCTQTLNTPTGYQGGAIRLELIQEVNGEMTSTQVVDGEKLTFPYTLDITGAPGVSAGTLYVSEQINGDLPATWTVSDHFPESRVIHAGKNHKRNCRLLLCIRRG